MNFTQEQQAAITSESDRIAVRAAAGSGKTRVLVERYLRHVTDLGHTPDRLLTITFTRKAAAEMKSRIVAALREQELYDEAQMAETGPIQTIHGLCDRLLRENAIAGGLDPEFRILSQGQSAVAKQQAIHRALVVAGEEEGRGLELIRRLSGRSGQAFRSTTERLVELIDRFLDKMRSALAGPDEVEERFLDPIQLVERWTEEALNRLDGEIYQSVSDQPLQQRHAEFVKAMRAEPRKLRAPFTNPDFARDAQQAEDTCALADLALAAWHLLEERMEASQEFDFPYLEQKAVRLLANSKEAQQRVSAQYDAALIDEAQDINPVQDALIRSLDIESELMVGDPRQSIYRFRHADRRLFVERCQESEELNLSRNFRSKDGILAFVDLLFSRVWKGDYQPMAQPMGEGDPDDPFDEGAPPPIQGVEVWPMAARDSKAVATGVSQLVKSGSKPRDIAILVRSNWFAGEVAESLSQKGIAAVIAGGSEKFFTRLEIRDLANALVCLTGSTDRFPWLALLLSPYVGLSLDEALPLIQSDQPLDAILREDTDIPGLVEFREWAAPLAEIGDRLAAWELIGMILARSPILVRLAERPDADQALANIRKMLRLATGQAKLSPGEFAEQMRDVQELRHGEGDAPTEDADADVVTIMTIHKAKGLEFDTVIVPDTFSPLHYRADQLQIDSRTGLAALKLDKAPSLGYSWISQLEREQGEDEEWRLMYVALTRAEQKLCLAVADKAMPKKMAGALSAHLGLDEGLPPGVEMRQVYEER